MSNQAAALATVVIVALGLGGGYLLALWRHPERHCPRCDGKGRHEGTIWRGRRQCTRCGGKGRVAKIGTYIWEEWLDGKPSRFRSR